MSPEIDAAFVIVHDEYLVSEQKDEQVCCDPVALSEMQSGCLDNAIAGLSQVHMEYTVGGVGVDGGNGGTYLDEYKRFKQLAADLVIQKEEDDIQKSMVLGDEDSVNQEESVECVKGTFLQEITGETWTPAERNAIHAITVGELLLKLEV